MLMYTSAETVFIVIKLKIRQWVKLNLLPKNYRSSFEVVGDFAISGLCSCSDKPCIKTRHGCFELAHRGENCMNSFDFCM
jgi:hypothetical protein